MRYWRREEPVDLSTFDPDGKYTPAELDRYAEAMLKEDIRENGNVGHVLLTDHLKQRARREHPVDASNIDGTITQMLSKTDRPVDSAGDGQKLYNRSHPRGRKVNSKRQRTTHGASYYR
jgi:hypothetical protein